MRLRSLVLSALLIATPLYAGPASAAEPSAVVLPSPLFASVLPSSRSVLVGAPATAFATVINAGGGVAEQIGISLGPAIPALLGYRTTDCATNLITGGLNVPADIPPGGVQCFVFSILPTAPFSPQVLAPIFSGPQSSPVATINGVNTLLLSSNTSTTPDVVAVAATIGNTGTVLIPSAPGTGVFAVAVANVGVTGLISVVAGTGSTALPLTFAICLTDALGFCVEPPAPSVTTAIPGAFDMGAPGTATFGVFVAANGPIVFDPAANRVFVRFVDPGNVTRGSTSVAVRTP